MQLAVSLGSVGEATFVDFPGLLLRLVDSQTRFVVVGGVAMCLQGTANVTFDLDVAISNEAESSRQTVDTLATQTTLRKEYRPSPVIKAKLGSGMFVSEISLRIDHGQLDLLHCRAGEEGFLGLWNRATLLQVGNSAVRVASVEDLITLKRVANRPYDREHIMQLEALSRLQNADSN